MNIDRASTLATLMLILGLVTGSFIGYWGATHQTVATVTVQKLDGGLDQAHVNILQSIIANKENFHFSQDVGVMEYLDLADSRLKENRPRWLEREMILSLLAPGILDAGGELVYWRYEPNGTKHFSLIQGNKVVADTIELSNMPRGWIDDLTTDLKSQLTTH